MSKKVKLYDPARDAYFTADIETAKKYIAALEEAKKAVKEAK
jgi:hypothetical protein